MKPEMEWVRIGPAEAKEMLRRNSCNRKLRSSVVQRYAGDMSRGWWRETGEPIILDEYGNLLDGQHRLEAVVVSEVTVLFLVVRNIPKVSASVIDSGLGRDVLDAAHFLGRQGITADMVACARGMNTYGRPGQKKRTMSQMAVLDFIDKHRAAIDTALEATTPKTPGVTLSPVRAAFGVASYYVDNSVLLRAGRILCTGPQEQQLLGDRSVLKLREWLLLSGARGGAIGTGCMLALEMYGKTCRAIKAMVEEKDLTRLYALETPDYLLSASVA